MTNPARPIPECADETAELAALRAAVEEARRDPRSVDHKTMRDWLLEIAAGKLDTPPPQSR
jgi:hypothetical protein